VVARCLACSVPGIKPGSANFVEPAPQVHTQRRRIARVASRMDHDFPTTCRVDELRHTAQRAPASPRRRYSGRTPSGSIAAECVVGSSQAIQLARKRLVRRLDHDMQVPLIRPGSLDVGQHLGCECTRRFCAEGGYLKVSAVGVENGVADEHQRLQWAVGKLPVPSLIDAGDDEGMKWMLLGPLPGTDGTDPLRLAHPEQLVRMLATALRQLHDFPPSACPFDFRLPTAMAHVETRLRCGQIDTTEFEVVVEYAHHTAETAVLALRRDLPAAEDLVITHGARPGRRALTQGRRGQRSVRDVCPIPEPRTCTSFSIDASVGVWIAGVRVQGYVRV
jgi:hypothetical protein